MVNRTRVEGGGYSKHDIITSVEVLFYVYWWCKTQYICRVFNKSCSGLCHIYSWFLHVVGIESECFVVYLSCVYIYIYVRLIMSSYLLFCLVYYMLSK